ncbi:MAG: glycoside hydrolase family 2 TIM barrel-domain containing protein [Atopobiaceae bacterium]
MRCYTDLDQDWEFTGPDGSTSRVDVPHTWNAQDGQDGGNDYWRGTCTYRRAFETPEGFDAATQAAYLVFDGVNASADVTVNGEKLAHHDGGYSTFHVNVTKALAKAGAANELVVAVDNSVNDRVYPQKADFTFYGGIYRDVKLLVVASTHFALEYHGGPGIAVTPEIEDGAKDAAVEVRTWIEGSEKDAAQVKVRIFDADGKCVVTGKGTDAKLVLEDAHRWDGRRDPYLYKAKADLLSEDGSVIDTVSTRFGVRSFSYDPKKGFFLNGRSYPLRGVARHQDRKGIGNALTPEMHEEDIDLICEIGANTVRLAHYQHAQHFYDLCDERGLVVWAEIPYISEHLAHGNDNTRSQMEELIIQNYNHASIVCWGLSNEITISTHDKKAMLQNHYELNDLCHKLDPIRFTTLACYAMCGPFNRVAFISDVVSWNLYLGWYVPGMWLNDLWFGFFHLVHPKRTIGMSEYGCEAMPNLHSEHPRRGDHSEEYQCRYHEYMLRFFDRHPYLWATHCWNMFDFAADARNQGGEPGMNHKGLVTFDRKTKKDSFYLYKCWWNEEPMVHICSKRFRDRAQDKIRVKVYSNQSEVTLCVNGEPVATKQADKVFTFDVTLQPGKNKIEVKAGALVDTAEFWRVRNENPAYSLKGKGGGGNWT